MYQPLIEGEKDGEEMDRKASVNKLLEEMTERLLVCEVCMEDFQSPQRLPRVLPCHHAYCDQCLEGLCKDNHLKCPQCRRSVTVGAPFPVETTGMALLDLRKLMEGQYCEGCSEKAKAIVRCLECEESLCEDCCQAHKVIRATRDHNLVSLAEAAIDPSKLLQLTEKCGKHEEKKLKFYCTECRQPACSSCAVLSHTGHKMVVLEAVLDSEKIKLNAECQRLREVVSTFQARVDSSTHRLQQFDARREEISSKVQEYFTRAKNLLNDREAKVLSELDAMAKEDKQVLEDQQASDQSLLSEAQATLEFGERISLLGLPSQLLSRPEDMAKTCDDLEKRSTLPRNPDPVYEMDGGIEVLTAAVNKIGNIKRKAVDDGAYDQSSSVLNSRNPSKRRNCEDGSEKRRTALSAPEPVSQRLNTQETVQPVVVKAEGKVDGSQKIWTSFLRSPSQCVPVGVLALPRSRGAFKDHLDSVTRSLVQEVQQVRKVRFANWVPGDGSGDSIALIVFLSQGSPGVEFPGAVPQELRDSSQRVVVVVIQDDETSTATKDIVPKDVHLMGVVNVHVIPMQHQLHRQGSSLCARNKQAVKEIAHLLSP